jgi:hypothetical protein
MPFKNFKSPTIREPQDIYYQKTLECLLFIQNDYLEVYKELAKGPQFEYDIHIYFKKERSAREYLYKLTKFLKGNSIEKRTVQLPEAVIGNTIKSYSRLIWS